MLLLLATLLAPGLITPGATAVAEDYPTHPVTLIVPFPVGGGVDAMGRLVAHHLTQAFGQQVIVDNKGGAAGVVGMRVAMHAHPDGYTLVMTTSGSTSISPLLYADPGYDSLKDFVPIGLIASSPIVLMAHPSFSAHSVKEVIALAQKGGVTAGTPPPGTENYMAAELFKSMTGADITIVSYKGTGPLTNDLLGAHVGFGFNTLPPAMGNLQAGTLRAIAVAGSARSGLLPDVPTATESGLPGFEAAVRYGLMAPAGTPRPIVDRINRELRSMVSTEETRNGIIAQGSDPLTSSPEEYAADIARETAKWSALIKKLGLKLE